MPTKHIPESTWRKVEEETVRATIETQKPIKDTEVLNILILKGLKEITEKDYRRLAGKKKGRNYTGKPG